MDNPSPSVAQARAPSPLSFLLLTPTLSDSPTSFPLGADPESDHFLSQPNPYHLPLPLGSQRDLSHWPRCSCCGLSSTGDTTSRVKLPDQSTLTQTQSTQEPHLTWAHMVCTLSLQWPDLPLPFARCTPASVFLAHPNSTGGHILRSSASCLTPHRDLLKPHTSKPVALSPQPCHPPSSCFFLPRTHCCETH